MISIAIIQELRLKRLKIIQPEMLLMIFLIVNRFGSLRDDNDPNCTYEGDNNMLLGQTSNHLLSLLYQLKSGMFPQDFL